MADLCWPSDDSEIKDVAVVGNFTSPPWKVL